MAKKSKMNTERFFIVHKSVLWGEISLIFMVHRKTKCILSLYYVSETTNFSVPFLPLLRVKNSLWVLFNKIKIIIWNF